MSSDSHTGGCVHHCTHRCAEDRTQKYVLSWPEYMRPLITDIIEEKWWTSLLFRGKPVFGMDTMKPIRENMFDDPNYDYLYQHLLSLFLRILRNPIPKGNHPTQIKERQERIDGRLATFKFVLGELSNNGDESKHLKYLGEFDIDFIISEIKKAIDQASDIRSMGGCYALIYPQSKINGYLSENIQHILSDKERCIDLLDYAKEKDVEISGGNWTKIEEKVRS